MQWKIILYYTIYKYYAMKTIFQYTNTVQYYTGNNILQKLMQ